METNLATAIPLAHRIEPMRLDPARVRARRQALGLTQEQLAERTGMTQGAISRVEKGKLTGAMRDTQDRLAVALECSVDYLCGVAVDAELRPAPVPAREPQDQEPPSGEPIMAALPNWPELLSAAKRLAPDIQPWVWEKMARARPWLEGPLTPASVRDLARVIESHSSPPARRK